MKRLLYWLPALVWASLLFFLSSQSSLPGEGIVPDLGSHYVAYLILALFCAFGFAGRMPLPPPPAVYWQSWITATVYGMSDEWHQMFTPGRTPSWEDVLADGLGALTGMVVLALVGRARRRQKQERDADGR